jgi:hypothetical protein
MDLLGVFFNMKTKLTILLFLIFSYVFKLNAQHYRISMDLTIKEKSDSINALYKGKVFYDVNYKQLIYKIKFPVIEDWVFTDSSMSIVRNNKIVFTNNAYKIESTNIFKLFLLQQLNNFGLNKSPYILYQTKKVSGLTIQSFKPKTKDLGMIDLAYENKILSSVIFFKPKSNQFYMKLFFKDYITVKNIQVPTIYYQFIYFDKNEVIKKYQFKEIKIDDNSHEQDYFIDLSKLNK